MRPLLLALAALLLASGCPQDGPRRRPAPQAGPDAAASPLPPATLHQLRPPTEAERGHDRQRRPALRALITGLEARLADAGALAARTDATGWTAAREAYLARLGPLRDQALALDPLRQRSWAAAVAHRLIDLLAVHRGDAIPEAAQPGSSGAFETRRRDAAALLAELRRYADTLGQ
jgi:hypothetical protein